MSYSLKSNCGTCNKKRKCTDSCFVQGAIYGIHSVNYANGATKTYPDECGHLGGGTIEIQCCSYAPEETENRIEVEAP